MGGTPELRGLVGRRGLGSWAVERRGGEAGARLAPRVSCLASANPYPPSNARLRSHSLRFPPLSRRCSKGPGRRSRGDDCQVLAWAGLTGEAPASAGVTCNPEPPLLLAVRGPLRGLTAG